MNKAYALKQIYKVILENKDFAAAFKMFIEDKMAPLIVQCLNEDKNDERNRGSIQAFRSLLDIKGAIASASKDIDLNMEDEEDDLIPVNTKL